METLQYEVAFTTPAFLGDAERNGRWRTPPFKAQLRQWWRVAAVAGERPDTVMLHRRGGELFGRAAADGRTASQVKLRMDWRGGRLAKRDRNDRYANRFSGLTHREVEDRCGPTGLQPVGTARYLGYGPVDVGNRLESESAPAPGRPHVPEIGVPAAEEQRFHDLAAGRSVSPARHQAISTARDGFAPNLGRVLVEDPSMGKPIDAGRDLTAMVPVECHRSQAETEWPGPDRRLRDLLLTAEFPARDGRVGISESHPGD
ncbi:MAG TPA: hypothetical protein DHV08_15000 [Rhodocyclaceae bacterium]|nr:hypothetical protein [Rhodocyclaceae bacterium]